MRQQGRAPALWCRPGRRWASWAPPPRRCGCNACDAALAAWQMAAAPAGHCCARATLYYIFVSLLSAPPPGSFACALFHSFDGCAIPLLITLCYMSACRAPSVVSAKCCPRYLFVPLVLHPPHQM